jgi:hypothetical protein
MDIREGVEWICLPEDRDCWWAVVSTVMNLMFWHYRISLLI